MQSSPSPPLLSQVCDVLRKIVLEWNLNLSAGSNDCHTYTNALIQELCGIPNGLKAVGIF